MLSKMLACQQLVKNFLFELRRALSMRRYPVDLHVHASQGHIALLCVLIWRQNKY